MKKLGAIIYYLNLLVKSYKTFAFQGKNAEAKEILIGANLIGFEERRAFAEKIKVCYMKNLGDYVYYLIDLKDEQKRKSYTFRDLKYDACIKW